MAGLCAFLFPGLGHLIVGKPFQALIWFVIIVLGYFCFIVPGIVLHVISILDAARAAKREQVRTIAEGVKRAR